MSIARRQLGPGVADANDRSAIEEVIRQTLILHPTAMNEAISVFRTKPCGAAKFHVRKVYQLEFEYLQQSDTFSRCQNNRLRAYVTLES
jgi:hypothetical protein